MNRIEKTEVVQDLSGRIKRASAVILAEYRGLTVAQMTSLRKAVRQSEGEFHVIKNTLAKKAFQAGDFGSFAEQFRGPMAIAIALGDPVLLAKAISRQAAELEPLKIKSGFFAGKVISIKEVEVLSNLPSREELYAKLLGTLMAPVTNFVRVLNALPTQVVRAIKEIEKTKGG